VENVRPSLVALITLAYRDAGRALWALRSLVLTASLICLAHSLADMIMHSPGFGRTAGGTGRQLADLALTAGLIFLLVPFLIAVHRFVLLDETQPHYLIEPKSPRTLRFFGSWIALSLVAFVPVMISAAALAAVRLLDWWYWILVLPLVLLPIVLCLRMTLLFPAIAVDAPGATWTNAYHDTKGHSWGIFLIYLVATIPAILFGALMLVVGWLLLAVASLAMRKAGVPYEAVSVLRTLGSFLIVNVYYVCTAALMVVIASRLFQLLGDRVRHLSEPQSA
jgi:hypothetical protein